MKKLTLVLFVAALFAAINAPADVISTYGDVSIVTGPNSQPAWLIKSDPSGAGYGGLADQITGTLTPNSLTTLASDYFMTVGTFNGGAPRFTLFDTTNNTHNSAYVYWGTPQPGGSFTDPNFGATDFNSTGNLANAGSSDLRVESNGFGGLQTGPLPYITWQSFLNQVGATDISYVTLDLDGGFSPPGQQMEVQNFRVNDATNNPTTATPEPKYLPLVAFGLVALVLVARKLNLLKREVGRT